MNMTNQEWVNSLTSVPPSERLVRSSAGQPAEIDEAAKARLYDLISWYAVLDQLLRATAEMLERRAGDAGYEVKPLNVEKATMAVSVKHLEKILGRGGKLGFTPAWAELLAKLRTVTAQRNMVAHQMAGQTAIWVDYGTATLNDDGEPEPDGELLIDGYYGVPGQPAAGRDEDGDIEGPGDVLSAMELASHVVDELKRLAPLAAPR